MSIRLSLFGIFLFGFFIFAPTLVYAQVYTPASTQSFEKTLIALTNSDRLTQNTSLVVEDPLLSAAAQKKADDMLAKGYFSHYSPDGAMPWQWITAAGYYYTHAGENLAMHFDDPQKLESAWMASPAHRANILKGVYTQVGIGVAHGMYLGQATTFVVEFFATPAMLATTKVPGRYTF